MYLTYYACKWKLVLIFAMKSRQLKSNVILIQRMRKCATFELPNLLSSRKDKQELGLKTSYPLKTSIHWEKVIYVSLLYALFSPI